VSMNRGVDLFRDIRTLLPRLHLRTIFDVGANEGQSAEEYLKKFPDAQIYCFEPVSATYEKLCHRLSAKPRVRSFNLGLGKEEGAAKILCRGPSTVFRMTTLWGEAAHLPSGPTESIKMVTIDKFCKDNGTSEINYLKVDTEGGDLDVLKGAESMLGRQRIDLVEVEAGMNPFNEWHVPFENLKSFLEARHYYLFGIYEQFGEFPTREPHLRRTNCVYISEARLKMCRG
jgi:FkbM family methyltransferase